MANFEDALKELKENDVDVAIGMLQDIVNEENHPHAWLAACKLGDIFYDGHGGTYKNDVVAAGWYFKAAKMQSAEAQYMLGEFCINGWGVPQNPCQAHKWYNLAASNGHKKGAEARDEIARSIRPERVAQAQDLAWDFVEEFYLNTL